MKKIVLDPPHLLPKTAHTDFATCRGMHGPLLRINPDITLEHMLVHLATSLASAMETNLQVCEMARKPLQRLTWATQHNLDICEAMLETLMKRGEGSKAVG